MSSTDVGRPPTRVPRRELSGSDPEYQFLVAVPACTILTISEGPLMEDEEDDVFRPNARSWETTFREIKHEDRSTQTPGPALVHRFSMLPCGVAHEPRRLFYGMCNAGFRLHFPAHFERARNPEQGQRNRPEHHPRPSAEVRIGQKLQVIGDQFHQDQVELSARLASSLGNHGDSQLLVQIEGVALLPCGLRSLSKAKDRDFVSSSAS
ncbi:bcl-2-modifying factor-like [Scleropages formosus]|uniref:Bcl-2-modifying factor-like n=1 Tax=Scleropages formosus TaxID=113540 RepID=A0A0P7UHG4_SCLFO|nr:bcl-2-modifying factor-like [Scleropages formosus]